MEGRIAMCRAKDIKEEIAEEQEVEVEIPDYEKEYGNIIECGIKISKIIQKKYDPHVSVIITDDGVMVVEDLVKWRIDVPD